MTETDTAHHIKALPHALESMKVIGFTAEQCLEGTGLTEEGLADPGPEPEFTLQQQYRFHRNLLALTSNPMLGLIIGKIYTLESFGLLGYAFMSAPTLRHALVILRNYGPLSFTLDKIDFLTEGSHGILRFSRNIEVPQDLRRFYIDRDLTNAIYGGKTALREPLVPIEIRLMHDGQGQQSIYERHFRCPVSFNAPASELHFDASLLDTTLPLGDTETSAMCQQQCRMLLARMSRRSSFVDRVRQLIMARPGYFPDIDYVAEKLNMTSRTLRRRLTEENSSYQELLAELKYQLAREYLKTSTLPLEEISVLLGYSAPGNFTNAFKRWHGSSPRQFRLEAR